jgi:oligoendopeptidase F
VLRISPPPRSNHAGPRGVAAAARDRFLTLLRSGGNDYPMEQLKKAGVDLAQPDTVLAIVSQLEDLVTRLEQELAALA